MQSQAGIWVAVDNKWHFYYTKTDVTHQKVCTYTYSQPQDGGQVLLKLKDFQSAPEAIKDFLIEFALTKAEAAPLMNEINQVVFSSNQDPGISVGT